MQIHDLVTEDEYGEVLDGVIDLLRETYHLSEVEAKAIVKRSWGQTETYLPDYEPFVSYLSDVGAWLRETLDAQFAQAVHPQQELQKRMSADAAVWLAFECIRRYCRRSLAGL
ncbi:hypothetical protein [Paenibacillus koleovorans]|uniref:hypothetical protein n=1 Tax=Paenibacillus koleovorans TaxID=121608 RepID=UPI000FD9B048|nr:hypothetical protein [Paenibacillus koleovorans]